MHRQSSKIAEWQGGDTSTKAEKAGQTNRALRRVLTDSIGEGAIHELIRKLPRSISYRVKKWMRPGVIRIDSLRDHVDQPGVVPFRCNVCSALCAAVISDLSRETGHCPVCNTQMRGRSLVHLLSMRLFGKSLVIDEFPEHARELVGIGMSDVGQYAEFLQRKLRYTNTFYHKNPRLDIQNPGPEHIGAYDFVISSDVMEHVPPPISSAFKNLRAILKTGGVLVLTVPFTMNDETHEHFPDLYEYQIVKRNGSYILTNRTVNGQVQEHGNLMFHGGPGSTLEMRVFSESGLFRELGRAGFGDITVHRESWCDAGIYWKDPWSVPMTAVAI